MRLQNHRYHEKGSRKFAEFEAIVSPRKLAEHIGTLEGAQVTEVLEGTPPPEDAWIDFEYGGHAFNINCHWGQTYFFFSEDDDCPESTMIEVAEHCATIVLPTSQMAEPPSSNP